jgi:hypothetical protein
MQIAWFLRRRIGSKPDGVYVHSMTIKFPNWRYYSNTTNAIYRGWTTLVRENVYLHDVQVSNERDYLVYRDVVGKTILKLIFEDTEHESVDWIHFVQYRIHFEIILPAALWPRRSTQPLTEMSTRNLPAGKGGPARKADKVTAICEATV